MFFEDAEKASRILDLVLTGRDCGLERRAPMCGVPYHAVDNYIRRLIDAGCRVAICEQLTDPKESKGMVERDVVRVVTPGTLVEEDILDEKKSNYLASVYAAANGCGLAEGGYQHGGSSVSPSTRARTGSRNCRICWRRWNPASAFCNEKFLPLVSEVR